MDAKHKILITQGLIRHLNMTQNKAPEKNNAEHQKTSGSIHSGENYIFTRLSRVDTMRLN